ncbi:MAG: hypothetical protein EOO56_28925 [Hymenobacter sp.]|nr:MAG: hypothetical protein EOO56_28925 [Hymenobacter sp.]
MSKILFFGWLLLLSSFGAHAQSTSLSFIKISHLGTAGRPIPDLYLSTQEPALSPEQGIDGRYKFQSVCLLTEAEFGPLLRYAESYTAKNKPDSENDKFGTFELTLGPVSPARKFIYTRKKSLAFLNAAVQVLEKNTADADTNEALRRLRIIVRRLSADNP